VDPDTHKELCQPHPKDDLDAYVISNRVIGDAAAETSTEYLLDPG